ncbi:MAG: prolipoprotein diacylglyceryl transferase family protein [Gemmataceae bacterium]
MRQILFEIPTPFGTFPIFGYGFMLFLAFVFCTLLAARMAKRQGIKPEYVQDLAIWIFVCGIAGARIAYVTNPEYWHQFTSIWQLFKVWDGGLIFFGSAIGGLVGFLGAYFFILKKHNISAWKMVDIVAPCVALGLCIGRFGCMLNGCCFGGVACPPNPGIVFPLPTAPRSQLTDSGHQTAAGFTIEDREENVIEQIIPGSAAAEAGLQGGDSILEINGNPINSYADIETQFYKWPRGENTITLKIRRGNQTKSFTFVPSTIPLHPTQLYESISCGLLFALLLAYYPLRRRDGEVVVLLMMGYSAHRFINEALRNDTAPFPPFGFTYSQNISLILFMAGLGLGIFLRLQLAQYSPGSQTKMANEPESSEPKDKPSDELPPEESVPDETKQKETKPSATPLQD